MNKIKKILIFVFLLISCLTISVNSSTVHANEHSSSPTILEGLVQSEIIENKLYIFYDNKSINISIFDMYYFSNGYVLESYYVGDVLKDADEPSKVACLTINYNNNTEKFDDLNLQIFERDDNIFYNLKIILSNEAISLLTSNSIIINQNTNSEIISRLNTSLTMYSQLQVSILQSDTNNDTPSHNTPLFAPSSSQFSRVLVLEGGGGGSGGGSGNGETPLDISNITTNFYSYNSYGKNYDNYTNADGIILFYENNYFGQYKLSDGNISDDPITQIIPKELCFQLGQHLYIGREYGFFINTTIDYLNSSDYCVDVLIFDIIKEMPNFSNQTYEGKLRITPIFQFRYRAVDKTRRNNMWDGFDSSLTRIVYPHLHYSAPKYFLRNVSFTHSIENETELNYGQSGYNPSNDNGAFFIQTRYNYSGIGLRKYKGSFVRDTISYLFGFVDPTSGTLSYLASLAAYGEYEESYQSSNEENINTYATNRYYQIHHYGKLLKKLEVSPKQVSNKPVMFGIGNYVESVYTISYYNEAVPTRIINSISLDIGVDNTDYYLFGIIKTGDFYTYKTEQSYYSTSKGATFSNNSQTRSHIEFDGDCSYYKFTPTFTGKYVFETTGSTDTYMRLYNSTNNQLAYNDDGGENLNSRIIYTLTAGNTYYIKVHGYNTRTGEFHFSIKYNHYGAMSVILNTPVTVNIQNPYEFVLYKFVATTNGVHTFETIGESDAYLYLYDFNMMQIAYNDDGGLNYNSKISYNLIAGETYYILGKCYGNKIGSHTLKVSK